MSHDLQVSLAEVRQFPFYAAGEAAASAGHVDSANPHEFGTPASSMWLKGWMMAYEREFDVRCRAIWKLAEA